VTQPWFTWANLLTASRVLAIPPTVICILDRTWFTAAMLFTAAVVTDFYDGRIARRLHQTSPLGGLFDHATDAMYVTLGCWAIAQLDLINPVLPWLIPLAFVQYMLDSKALAGAALRTSTIGRWNGVAYYVVLGTVIGSELLQWQSMSDLARWAAWVLVVSTIVSMLDRAMTLLRKPKA